MKAMNALRVLAEISVAQWGMFTAAQARAEGVSRVDLARLADAGHIVRLAHGVYRDAGAPGDEFEDLRAVWLSTDPARTAAGRVGDGAEGAVVSGATASWVHGAGDLRPEPYEFTIARRRQTQREELRYRVRAIPDTDVTIKSGLPVTTLERTIADLVETHTDLSLVAGVLGDAIQTRPLDLDRLAALLAPLAARNGFSRGDGVALRHRLMELAGLDVSTLAGRIATSDLGKHVVLTALEPWTEQLRAIAALGTDHRRIQSVLEDSVKPFLERMDAAAAATADLGRFQSVVEESVKPFLEKVDAAAAAAADLGRFHSALADHFQSLDRYGESVRLAMARTAVPTPPVAIGNADPEGPRPEVEVA